MTNSQIRIASKLYIDRSQRREEFFLKSLQDQVHRAQAGKCRKFNADDEAVKVNSNPTLFELREPTSPTTVGNGTVP
jgi:hypothetical protein